MTDSDTRRFERSLAVLSGEDEARLLARRLLSGDLDPRSLALAAALGYAPARDVLGLEAEQTWLPFDSACALALVDLPRVPPDGCSPFGALRVAAALVSLAVTRVEIHDLARRTLTATRRFLVRPSSPYFVRVSELSESLFYDKEGSDEAADAEGAINLLADAVLVLGGPGHERADDWREQFSAQLDYVLRWSWRGIGDPVVLDEVREALEAEVVPWLLTDTDPLVELLARS